MTRNFLHGRLTSSVCPRCAFAFQASLPEHLVIESKPDNTLDDLRCGKSVRGVGGMGTSSVQAAAGGIPSHPMPHCCHCLAGCTTPALTTCKHLLIVSTSPLTAQPPPHRCFHERLHDPFPELHAFSSSIDLDTGDSTTHLHVPFPDHPPACPLP